MIQPGEGPVKIADNDSNSSAFEIELKLFDKFEATNKECVKQNLAPSFGFIYDPDHKVADKDDDTQMVAKPSCIYTFGAPVIEEFGFSKHDAESDETHAAEDKDETSGEDATVKKGFTLTYTSRETNCVADTSKPEEKSHYTIDIEGLCDKDEANKVAFVKAADSTESLCKTSYKFTDATACPGDYEKMVKEKVAEL